MAVAYGCHLNGSPVDSKRCHDSFEHGTDPSGKTQRDWFHITWHLGVGAELVVFQQEKHRRLLQTGRRKQLTRAEQIGPMGGRRLSRID